MKIIFYIQQNVQCKIFYNLIMTQIKKNLVDLSTQIDDDCSKSTSN